MATGASKSGAGIILALYRRILRIHVDKLPGPLRDLGDGYVREEFRRHLHGKTNTRQWEEFVRQWTEYAARLSGQADLRPPSAAGAAGSADRSGDMPEDLVAVMNPEQRQMLERLRHEAQQAAGELVQGEVDAVAAAVAAGKVPGDSSGRPGGGAQQ